MLSKVAYPIRLDIQVSRLLVIVLSGLHSLAVWVFWNHDGLDNQLSVLLIVVTVMSGVYSVSRYALLIMPDSILQLVLNESGWTIFKKNGISEWVEIADDTVVWPYFIGLVFRRGWHT